MKRRKDTEIIYFFEVLKLIPEGLKETGSRYVAQAGVQWLFTGAIPLLISTGVLTCSVSDLGRFTPP